LLKKFFQKNFEKPVGVSKGLIFIVKQDTMAHKVFIRHTYIYKCSNKKCGEEWKINEASNIEMVSCPHCSKKDNVEYVLVDQREKYNRKWGSPL